MNRHTRRAKMALARGKILGGPTVNLSRLRTPVRALESTGIIEQSVTVAPPDFMKNALETLRGGGRK